MVMGSNPSHCKGDDRPVEQVSWEDCQEFCRKEAGCRVGRVFETHRHAPLRVLAGAGAPGKMGLVQDWVTVGAPGTSVPRGLGPSGD
jgi:hypothetical protein